MITMTCSCGQLLQIKDEYAGRQMKCPKCGQHLQAPSLTDKAPEPWAASAAPPGAPHPRPSEAFADADNLPVGRTAAPGRREGPREGERASGPPQVSGKAIAALIFGILTLLMPLFMIPAIILGFVAKGDIQRSQGRLTGGGMALAGLILGFFGLAYCLILPAFLVPAVQKVREAAARTQTMNCLKQIGLAMHNYHDVHRQLPPAVVFDKNGKALYSWRVLLLPYLEANNTYLQFKLDEPWDGPNNMRLLQSMPPVYGHPGASNQDRTLTYFQVFDGPAGDKGPRALFVSKTSKRIPLKLGGGPALDIFQSDYRMSLGRIPDGSSNTIMVAEAADGVPWTKPADLVYEPDQPLPKLGGHFSSGFLVSMADGSVRTIDPRRVNENTLRLAITADDGQLLPGDW
jgi:hypothetical protein